MSDQDNGQVSTLQRPTTNDTEEWKTYWRAQGWPWRTEPEIDALRQKYLAKRRAIVPDIEKGIYPFKDIELNRADVEWLLATHENGRGPVDWSDESQRNRLGLDLRGTNLSQVDLSYLPLIRLRGGLTMKEWINATREQIEAAAIHLEESNLKKTHLEGGVLNGAFMRKADLTEAHLMDATLREAHLEKANLTRANLQEARLLEAHLERSSLTTAHLERASLIEAHLEGADLSVGFLKEAHCHRAHLEGAFLITAHLEGAQLVDAHLEWAVLYQAHLEHSFLERAHLEGAVLRRAHLEGANLSGAHLEGKKVPLEDLRRIQQCFHEYPLFDMKDGRPDWRERPDFLEVLPPADLQEAFFDSGTRLNETVLGNKTYGFVNIADLSWGGVNLAVLKAGLRKMNLLGDEQKVLQQRRKGISKNKNQLLDDYEAALRANRQFAVALQSQGLNEDASRFAYRAQLCQRTVLRLQKKFGQYLFSGFLDILAGYGYRPGRSVLWYLAVILGFALAYFAIGHLPFFPDAFVFSLTSFHGRGFFPGLGSENSLHNPLVILAAFEAVIGLLIEISFIATFTQRFFGR